MILINLYGGPGIGKTVLAASLFAALKRLQVKAELVGEAAKDIVLDGNFQLLENQVLITGLQFQRIKRLEKAGCAVAISDSPLIQGIMYIQEHPYHEELGDLIRKLESLLPETYSVAVRRKWPYEQFGRYQDEAGAKRLDQVANTLIERVWLTVDPTAEGERQLFEAVQGLLL